MASISIENMRSYLKKKYGDHYKGMSVDQMSHKQIQAIYFRLINKK